MTANWCGDMPRRHSVEGGTARSSTGFSIADGSTRWVRHKIVSHRDGAGRLVRNDGIVEDITERKVIEERFRMLVESAPDGMVVVDERGRIILVNAAGGKLFGYGRRSDLRWANG